MVVEDTDDALGEVDVVLAGGVLLVARGDLHEKVVGEGLLVVA